MARPRAFDNERALDAALDCFWRRGFEATSVRDLTAGMGINGPSLYNAYGDKRTLFSHALERYAQRWMRARLARLDHETSGKRAIHAFLSELIERSLNDRSRRGCLIVNSALEVSPHDAELRSTIASYLREIEMFLLRCLERGQAAGEIAPDIDPPDAARHLLGVVLGIRVVARSRPERALLEGMVRPALQLLERTT